MEAIIRFCVFIGLFLGMIYLEFIRPKRKLIYRRLDRWPVNIGIGLLNNLILRIAGGSIAYQAAIIASSHPTGLFNVIKVPETLAILCTLIVLDLAIYAQHVASHKWEWLWRFHQVHHTDIDFDATTSIRFHPIEIIISMVYKVLVIFLFGAHTNSVIAFEIILNSCAIFNHSNVNLPKEIDRILRLFIITPDVHRIHHSIQPFETDTNYGFSVIWWDRLFKTYVANSAKPQETMDLGLKTFRDNKQLGFFGLLLLPFAKDT